MRTSPLHGVYLLLDEQWAENISLVHVVQTAAKCGVRLFQYRNKTDSMLDCYRKGLLLRQATADVGATFIVNDRCDLALALKADGVHLGQDDFPLELARQILGEKKIIGISTHKAEQVEVATKEGADYLGFGPIFSTTTKANHDPVVGVSGLEQVRSLTTLPIFAIGGVTLDSLPAIQQAGGNGVAVASVVYHSVNIEETLQEMVTHFSAESP